MPGGAVGRRRPLVEAPLGRAGAAADRLGEHVALAPALEHPLLELGERGAWIDRAVGSWPWAGIVGRRRGARGAAASAPGGPSGGRHAAARAAAAPAAGRAPPTGVSPSRHTVLAPVSGTAPR